MEGDGPPVPPPLDEPPQPDCRRLWVGNLHPSVTEFKFLKMVEKFGALADLDFLYQRGDGGARTPRGFAFVTYQSQEAAESARRTLDGVRVRGRALAVRWATQSKTEGGRPAKPVGKPKEEQGKKELSVDSRIARLEAALSAIGDTPIITPDTGHHAKPAFVTYNVIERKPPAHSSRHRPYTRHQRPHRK